MAENYAGRIFFPFKYRSFFNCSIYAVTFLLSALTNAMALNKTNTRDIRLSFKLHSTEVEKYNNIKNWWGGLSFCSASNVASGVY